MAATLPQRLSAAEYLALAKKGNRSAGSGKTTGKAGIRVPSRRATVRRGTGRMTLADVREILANDPTQGDPFEIELPLTPTPKERPNHGGISSKTGKPVTYTPAQTRRFERNVASYVAHLMMTSQRSMYRVPLGVSFVHVFQGAADVFPTAKSDGDLSNLTKSVEDAMNGILYKDDGLITSTPTQGKICGPVEKIVVRVTPEVGRDGVFPREGGTAVSRGVIGY